MSEEGYAGLADTTVICDRATFNLSLVERDIKAISRLTEVPLNRSKLVGIGNQLLGIGQDLGEIYRDEFNYSENKRFDIPDRYRPKVISVPANNYAEAILAVNKYYSK